MINKRQIKLNQTDDVKEFVETAEKFDFDIDVFYNRVIIDAKSILGVLSLDLSKTLTVQYNEENQEFEQKISKFCVA